MRGANAGAHRRGPSNRIAAGLAELRFAAMNAALRRRDRPRRHTEQFMNYPVLKTGD
jgi:hypothetical protein